MKTKNALKIFVKTASHMKALGHVIKIIISHMTLANYPISHVINIAISHMIILPLNHVTNKTNESHEGVIEWKN